MSALNRRKALLIGIVSIALIITSTVLYFFLKPKHHAIPVYKLLAEDVYKPYFKLGQIRYFTKGALYCEKLDDIKHYYDHMNARNPLGVAVLIITGKCNYVDEDKVYAALEEVTGMFAKVTPQGTKNAAPRWMPVIELVRE
jgi:hypothetical protein